MSPHTSPVPASGRRGSLCRVLVIVAVVAVAVVLQRRHLAELPWAFTAVRHADPVWLAVGVAGSVITYVMAALAMKGTVHRRLSFRQLFQVQVAAGVTTIAAPGGLGSAGLNVWFLERVGVERPEALAAALRSRVAGGAVHIAGLAVVVWQLPHLLDVDAGRVVGVLMTVTKVVVVAAVVLAVVAHRRREDVARLWTATVHAWSTTVSLLGRRDRLRELIGGSIGLTLAYGVTLWACANAVGVPLDLPTAMAIELTVQALGAVSATPGGVGVVEAAGLQGLLLAGADPAAALAVVLLHRSVTFWLPALPGAVALRSLRRMLGPALAPSTVNLDDAGSPRWSGDERGEPLAVLGG